MSKLATVFLVFLSLCLPRPAHGGDEPAIRGDAQALPYLRELHRKVHRLWADNFLVMAAAQLPKDHPVNEPSRAVVLDVVLASDGKLADVKVEKPSGSSDFDASAVDVVKASAPFPAGPDDVVSDDGKVHVSWTLARDDRRCSGLSINHRTLALADAVKALVAHGRERLAMARLHEADDKERPAGISAFARAYLDRMENDPALAVEVAAANASAGDDRGAARLREAAAKEPTFAVVRGLAALKIPICPLIKDNFGKGQTAEARERSLWALSEGAEGECLALAIASAKNRGAGRMERVFALASLSHSEDPQAKATLKELIKDPDPNIKSAAILAEARPGAGRGAVFRLIPLLRDKSMAVRAAAAAALVRVGGEAVLPQLFQVFKEKDPAFFATLAPELGALSGEASAAMLARFLRKDNSSIRLFAARALVARRDEHAAKVQATLAGSTDPELQLLAGLALARDKRDAAVKAPLDEDSAPTFSALLRGTGRVVAGDWLLANLGKLDPAVRIAYLGQWLATVP